MGKSSPQAPAAPDPAATAAAQEQTNIGSATAQANLNRINQYTPQGSITYQQTGTNTDGTPQYSQTQTYSPGQQALYDQQNQIAQSLGGLAQNNISRVNDAQSQPFNFDNMTPMATNVQGGQLQYGTPNPQAQTQVGNAGQISGGYNTGGGIQTSFGTGGPLTNNVTAGNVQGQIAGAGGLTNNVQGGQYQTQIAGAGGLTNNVQGQPIQNSVSYGGLQSMPAPGDFNQAAQSAADASYGQATSRLDPQFQQQQSDLASRLANSGIAVGSDAYNRDMTNFTNSRNDAYNQANFSAQAAGLAAQQQGYGQALATRQQGVGEINTQGQFANDAQSQGYNQGLGNAQLNNQAQGQQFGQNQAQYNANNDAITNQFNMGQQNAQLNNSSQGQLFGQNQAQLQAYNAAQQQQYTQGMGNAQLNNSAQGQQYTQNQGAAAFGNQAQNQQNQQNAQQATFGNAAQDQQYQQNLSNAGFYNQGINQNFNQSQQNAALNNTAQGQAFNQGGANAQLNNSARQQQIDEATYLRNLPLNDIAALMGTGGGVQNPNFSSVPQVGVAAPDYQGAVYNNYNAQMQQYNQNSAARSQMLGQIFGAIGSVGGAVAMSDRRLKENIKRIGQLANGLATYTYNYIGDHAKQFGVMADEALKIVPEAVETLSTGIMMVDYGKVM